MPTYQYACTEPDCGNRFELVQSFTDPSASECPVCNGAVRKVYGSVGVVFKGSGFYRTDSRANGSTEARSEAKSETKSDTKAETTSDTKSDRHLGDEERRQAEPGIGRYRRRVGRVEGRRVGVIHRPVALSTVQPAFPHTGPGAP